jgi:von Willebrand factor type A domain
MLRPLLLLLFAHGFAAVLNYSDSVKVRQDFTADAEKITKSFKKIEPTGNGSDMHEAVAQAIRMLSTRQGRRVLI